MIYVPCFYLPLLTAAQAMYYTPAVLETHPEAVCQRRTTCSVGIHKARSMSAQPHTPPHVCSLSGLPVDLNPDVLVKRAVRNRVRLCDGVGADCPVLSPHTDVLAWPCSLNGKPHRLQ